MVEPVKENTRARLARDQNSECHACGAQAGAHDGYVKSSALQGNPEPTLRVSSWSNLVRERLINDGSVPIRSARAGHPSGTADVRTRYPEFSRRRSQAASHPQFVLVHDASRTNAGTVADRWIGQASVGCFHGLECVCCIVAIVYPDDGAHHANGSGANILPSYPLGPWPALICVHQVPHHGRERQVLEQHLRSSPDAAAEWAANRKLKNDPRITRVGAVLRKLSIDELPQLINVLRGEMSMVGPRPIVFDEVPLYGADIDFYFSARPGLTGVWQVSGRSDSTYSRRVALDRRYVEHWSLWTDLFVVIKTVPVVLSARSAY